jgi:hypothetical protein
LRPVSGGRYGLLWCSEFFDPASHGVHSSAALIPPSSSPKPLYYDVLNAVRTSDGGNQKLKDYRDTFARLARDWLSKGEITQFQHDDIVALVQKYLFTIWRLDFTCCRAMRSRTLAGCIRFRRTSALG